MDRPSAVHGMEFAVFVRFLWRRRRWASGRNDESGPFRKAIAGRLSRSHVVTMSHFAIRILLFIAVVAPVWPVAAPAVQAADGVRLVLGRISQEPRKHYARLKAMADFLALHLADQGVAGVDVVLAGSATKMEEMLRDGTVDILSETPFVALELEASGLVSLLLREWKGGLPEYRTLIVARKDGAVDRLEDLADRRFAFEDPGSTSGYLVPRAALEASGLSLVPLMTPRDPVPPGKVGYSFAKGEINVVAWVNRGLADAGALSDLDWESEKDAPAHLKADLKIIYRSPPIIRSVVMVRATMDDALKGRIRDVLTRMHETRAGQETLKLYFKVAKYDALEGVALDGLDTARSIWQQVNGTAD